MSGMDDNQIKMLIERAKTGDTEAFGELYSHCKGNAYRVAYRMTLNHEDAEDVMSQAVVYALGNIIAEFNSNQSFSAWFIGIVKRCAWQLCKNRKKHGKIKEALCLDKETEDKNHDSTRMINTLIEKEQNQILGKIFRRLPEKFRMILTDAYIEGMNHKEMSEKYHCSLQNVYYLIKVARQRAKRIARKLNYMLFL